MVAYISAGTPSRGRAVCAGTAEAGEQAPAGRGLRLGVWAPMRALESGLLT